MKWHSWIILILGIWLVVSPWVFHFSAITLARWSNVIAGVIILLATLWNVASSRTD